MTAAALQFDFFGAAPAPEPVGIITPRDYQLRAHEAINRELVGHRSTLVVSATGTGKTILFALQARERGAVLVIAHEESLIEQAAQKLRHVTGDAVWIEKAERRAPPGARYIVASMQSLRGDRLRSFVARFPDIAFIVIDEAHRALAQSYREIVACWPEAKLLGVTATPDRGDKRALAQLFETVAYRYDIADACDDGWLVLGDWLPMNVAGVKLDDVRVRNGDLDEGQLDTQVAAAAAQVAKGIIDHCHGERTIAFCPGVQSAIVGAEVINDIERGSAQAVYGALETEEKRAIKAAHKRGDFPYLLNCEMLTEGYDDERLLNVVMLSKTKSRSRFAQIYGRGGRPWPCTVDGLASPAERLAAIAASPKPRFRFYDANYGKHGHTLAGPWDVLGGKYDDAVRARAQKNLEKKGGGDVKQALIEAKEQIEAEKRRKVARQARRAAKAHGSVTVGAARGKGELFGEATEFDGADGKTFDARGWLVEQGVADVSIMGDHEVKRWRRYLLERERAGRGSWKQVKRLIACNVPRPKLLTKGECGRLLGALKLPGEGRPRYRDFDPGRDAWMVPAREQREPGSDG